MDPCFECKKTCDYRDVIVSCSGLCSKNYHAKCLSLSLTISQAISTHRCLRWYCDSCININMIAVAGRLDTLSAQINSFTEAMDLIRSSLSHLQLEFKECSTSPSDLESIKTSILHLQSDLIEQKNASNCSSPVIRSPNSDSTTSTAILPPPRRSKRIQQKKGDLQIEEPVTDSKIIEISDVVKSGTTIPSLICSTNNTSSTPVQYDIPAKVDTNDYSIRVALPRRWLFVTRVHHSVPEEHFRKLLNKITSTDDLFVHKITPKSSNGLIYDYVSYRINLPEQPFQAAIKSKLWPEGLLVKEFEWNQKKPFFQKLRLNHQTR